MSVATSPGPAAAEPAPELPDSVYRGLATVLRLGLGVALVLLVGALVALLARASASSSGAWTSSNPLVRYLDLRHLAAGLAAGTPEAYLTVGVYALIATPVLRVVGGSYAFLRYGPRRLGEITLVVLVLLLVGLFVLGPLIR
jgi:uncharacterized membrane protein